MKRNLDQTLGSLPPEWGQTLLPAIHARVESTRRKVIVLDDDPTGTQTVHQVDVLTKWSVPLLEDALRSPETVVYILTNSRSLPPRQARDLAREIAANLIAAGESTGREFTVISRSDSTLRGHYPLEVDVLATSLGNIDGVLIIPALFEGGRYTIDDTHYVVEDEWLIPAAETEFARDTDFGYRSSNLRAWVTEKTNGRWPVQQVVSITLEDIRQGGPIRVLEILNSLSGERPCVVNAASYRDLEVLVAAIVKAEQGGKRFLCRTAASFVRVRGGMDAAPLLQAPDLPCLHPQHGGLIVAGSYVRRTSAQLDALRDLPNLAWMEMSVPALLEPSARSGHIRTAHTEAAEAIRAGVDVLLFTSREVVKEQEGRSFQEIGQIIAESLIRVVQRLDVPPAWIIAKGGITSAVLASHGLNVRKARVLGQAIPGVPVWQTGPESRFPDLTYVVFPGNVGGPTALADMVKILRENRA
ncbi:MAG: hypothetical protein JW987_11950 [Anaerolineaceae bacterium]|nr:hypothetical protein [Anaerolineaceae bacterium]